MVNEKKATVKDKKIWQISREYAGIAEAGGVKNVCCSLAEEVCRLGASVTQFIPLYGCTNLKNIQGFDTIPNVCFNFEYKKKKYRVNFAQGYYNRIRIIFIINTCFTEKNGVYTYTVLDEALNSNYKSGNGHIDAILLDLMFQTAVLNYSLLTGDYADIIHCQDAATALIPFLARIVPKYSSFYEHIKFIVTIHNAGAGYHHEVPLLDLVSCTGLPLEAFDLGLLGGQVEPYLLSEKYARYTTVSPWYADELCNPENKESAGLSSEFFKRKTKIIGITNGIDYEKYNPKNTDKSLISYAYDPEKGDFAGKLKLRQKFVHYYKDMHISPVVASKNPDFIQQYGVLTHNENNVYFSFHGRLVQQKGIDILESAAKIVLEKADNIRFLINGQGSPDLENRCIELANRYTGKFLYLKGYERAVARECVAVSDFLLLPSYFEPCCLEDFIGQIFGAIPVAHAAGGLCKIINKKTGFLYNENTPQKLANMILNLTSERIKNPEKFLNLAQYASSYIHEEYSWQKIVKTYYIPLYLEI